jgi:hypothetical protein
MTGSTTKPATTDPLVEGGAYETTLPSGQIITGTVMGTWVDPTSKQKHGNMYLYMSGNIPYEVVEGTESLAAFTLVAAPSQKTGKTLAGMHRARKAKTSEE